MVWIIFTYEESWKRKKSTSIDSTLYHLCDMEVKKAQHLFVDCGMLKRCGIQFIDVGALYSTCVFFDRWEIEGFISTSMYKDLQTISRFNHYYIFWVLRKFWDDTFFNSINIERTIFLFGFVIFVLWLLVTKKVRVNNLVSPKNPLFFIRVNGIVGWFDEFLGGTVGTFKTTTPISTTWMMRWEWWVCELHNPFRYFSLKLLLVVLHT